MPEPIVSPDSRFALRFTCDQVSVTQWVYSPVLVDQSKGEVVFTLAGTLWSVVVAAWRDDSQMIIMGLRRYPYDISSICVRIDLLSKQACIDDSAYSLPLSQLYERLESRYQSILSAPGSRIKK